jgi:hypothetical protein
MKAKCPHPEKYKLEMSQGSVLAPTLYTLYINVTLPPPQTTEFNVDLFADDMCLYATDHKEGYVLRKLQLGLNPMESLGQSSMKIRFKPSVAPIDESLSRLVLH